MFYTTLNTLRSYYACPSGMYTLLASLPAGYDDNAPISLLHILESNGYEHAVWALQCCGEEGKRVAVAIAIACAEAVRHVYEQAFPDDSRIAEAIAAAKSGDVKRCKMAAGAAWTAAWAAEAATTAAWAANAAAWAAGAATTAARAAETATWSAGAIAGATKALPSLDVAAIVRDALVSYEINRSQ